MFTPPTIEIVANGERYNLWKSVTVHRVYDSPISIFHFVAAEGAYGTNYANLKLQPGDRIQIYSAGKFALTGRVASRLATYNAQTHDVVISDSSNQKNLAASGIPVKLGKDDWYTSPLFPPPEGAVYFGVQVYVDEDDMTRRR